MVSEAGAALVAADLEVRAVKTVCVNSLTHSRRKRREHSLELRHRVRLFAMMYEGEHMHVQNTGTIRETSEAANHLVTYQSRVDAS